MAEMGRKGAVTGAGNQTRRSGVRKARQAAVARWKKAESSKESPALRDRR